MVMLSRRTLYALEAVVDIAYHARPDPVQAKEVAERQGIPQRYLEQVMQHLVRAGILRGVRGPKGGYRLARERRRISVGDVVRLVGQLEALEAKAEEAPLALTSALGAKVLAPQVARVLDEAMVAFDAITLEDLCRVAEEAKTAKTMAEEPGDFTI